MHFRELPFRDRVTRRFHETVSQDNMFISPAVSVVSAFYNPNHGQISHSCMPLVYSNLDHVAVTGPEDSKSDPRLAPSHGHGSSCARVPAAARHDHLRRDASNKISGLGDDGDDGQFLRKALGRRLLRSGGFRKVVPKAAPRSRPWARQTTPTTGAGQYTRRSARLTPPSSDSKSSSSTSSPRATDMTSVGRSTRSRAKMTDENGKQLSPTGAYLSYYDIQLTNDDIRMLKNNDWLTDNNITFWQEWLEREVLSKYPQARITLLRPSLTSLLQHSQNPRHDLKGVLPDMSKVTHIFVPINDAVSRTSPDGSHWSLLLVSKIDGVAFHYDSLGGANNREASRFTDQLSQFLGMKLRHHVISDCPQQDNGNDCGVFVCILMRHLLVKRLLNANAREKVSMSMSNKMIDAKGGRKEMLRIIDSLRKEAERRRSASPFGKSDEPPRIE